jgi:hypothetical protein
MRKESYQEKIKNGNHTHPDSQFHNLVLAQHRIVYSLDVQLVGARFLKKGTNHLLVGQRAHGMGDL